MGWHGDASHVGLWVGCEVRCEDDASVGDEKAYGHFLELAPTHESQVLLYQCPSLGRTCPRHGLLCLLLLLHE